MATMDMTPQPDRMIERVSERLAALPGVMGVVLGGSRARGTATADSDVDIGLYYDPPTRPDFGLLLATASELDDSGKPLGHGRYGQWGPWINGGVWLTVDGYRTDVLLRDLDRVRRVIRAAAAGEVSVHYQPGHPHGFTSTIYAGEVFHNQLLHDPSGLLAELRTWVDPYPTALAEATIRQFGWEADFSLDNAASAARRGDVTQIAGLAHRSIACMNQIAFAVNRRYLLNEKGALAATDTLPRIPHDFRSRVETALSGLSPDPSQLAAVIAELRALHGEITKIASSG